MIEILFRGKRVDNKEWAYGDFFRDFNDVPHIINNNNYYKIDISTICQYTGLEDKNGKKIFENDLLKYGNGDFGETTDLVFYNEEYGTFEIALDGNKEFSEVLGFWINDLDEDTYCEVIGNIFDEKE